jgi:hypothetical protein
VLVRNRRHGRRAIGCELGARTVPATSHRTAPGCVRSPGIDASPQADRGLRALRATASLASAFSRRARPSARKPRCGVAGMPLWIPTSGCAIDSHQLIAAAILRCRGIH